MTVTNQNFRNNYVANGTNTSFSYTFKIFKNTDIAVYVNDVLISSGYTVTDVGVDAGGEVVFSTAPVNNSRVTLLRNELFTQEINPGFGDNDPSEQIEEGLDRSVFRDQYLLELINRCLQLSPSSSASIRIPTAEANKAIGWNSAGDALVNLAVEGGALLGNQDIVGWLKASSFLESQLFNVVQGGASDTEFGLDFYRTGSTQRDAVYSILELATNTVQASQAYTGNGTTTVYAVHFYVLASTDFQVKVNGTIATNYTLQNVGRRNGEMTVTFATAPSNGAIIILERINLTKYNLRKTIGLFSQHDKNEKLNYVDVTSEFTEFARGIRLPINPNAPTYSPQDIYDCNGVLRAGCHAQGTNSSFGGNGQRGITSLSKVGTGIYDVTVAFTAPTYAHPTITPVTTLSDITASCVRTSGTVFRIYTKLARTDTFTDCQFYFGLFY
jgi:hypothetical protein